MAGSFAEYVAIPRADLNLSKLPEGVSFAQAAALGCRFVKKGYCRSVEE